MMKDYPEDISIAIDSENLTRYRQQQVLTIMFMPFGGIGGVLGLSLMNPDGYRYAETTRQIIETTIFGLIWGALGLVCGIFVAVAFYYLLLHKHVQRDAEAWAVTVEGPFLRIKRGYSNIIDRKLHFRAIVDYSYMQTNWMRICGIEAIVLNTMAGGIAHSIQIDAVKDALQVRDMPSEIDSQRENDS